MPSLTDLRADRAPCPPDFNLAGHVLGRAKDDPDKIALAILSLSGSERWSYGRLERTVLGLAAALRDRGLAEGDRVLMRLGNTVEFPLVYLASIAAGLVPVPTSAQLTAEEAGKLAADLAPALIVAGAGVALPAGCPCPVLPEDDLHAMAEAPPMAPVPGDPDRPAYIVYTSGTSGSPRGVVHAHRAIWARQMMMAGWYGLGPADRLLHAGAFNWTYTLGTGLMDPWTMGATALIPAAGVTAAQLPLLLKRHDATIFAAAPGVYRQMLRAPMPALPKLRHGLSAGEKMPAVTRRAWQEATGKAVHEAFGMSEISTFLSGCPDRPAPEGTLGFVQPGRCVALLDPEGQPVPRGTPGTIAVAADDPGLMLRYLNAAEETRARFTADGAWFLTGDLGEMDGSGAIAYLGRDDDMMNAGGFRVSPIEVETVLAHHPQIAEAAAVEVAAKEGASIIAAFYTGAPVPGDELAAYAAEHLARYKCPRLFVHLEALPKSPNGKLMRRKIRTDYETTHDQA
ncbi:class I adenylate-forming enzyme family protein [Poseidonocella sp. HB161398]|uniref:class I adenylate-forming enzyme family protein n=1 Tax=Poseidonocella sp. HB161398 TaxID=2320855 RepID=UPI001107D0E8|nr:class I adenylate-forming enzyme family protein [Poseidonocella sp. HB161398]